MTARGLPRGHDWKCISLNRAVCNRCGVKLSKYIFHGFYGLNKGIVRWGWKPKVYNTRLYGLESQAGLSFKASVDHITPNCNEIMMNEALE